MRTAILVLMSVSAFAQSRMVGGSLIDANIDRPVCIYGPLHLSNPYNPATYVDLPDADSRICTSFHGLDIGFAAMGGGLFVYNEKGEFTILITFLSGYPWVSTNGERIHNVMEFNYGIH